MAIQTILQGFSVASYSYFLYTFGNFAAFLLNIGDHLPSLRFFFPNCIDFCQSSTPRHSVFGITNPVVSDALLIISFMAVHALFHSPRALRTMKLGLFTRPVGLAATSFFLHLLITRWRPLYNHIYVWDTTHRPYFMWSAFAAAFGWLVSTTFAVDHMDLFGLRDAFTFDHKKRLGVGGSRVASFTNKAHYGIVRHPVASGLFVMLFAIPMLTVNHAIFSLAMVAGILAAVRVQERNMLAEFGDTYAKYKAEIPAYIPMIFGRNRVPASPAVTKVKEVVPLAEKEKLNLEGENADVVEGKHSSVRRSISPENLQRKTKRW